MCLAAQFWCLLRKLFLLIGDRVPENDSHWRCLLLLIEVVDYIMAPEISHSAISYLELNLNVLFSEFMALFPNTRITPNGHYVLHYAKSMKQVGPLIRHWVMRYEAKHHYFKQNARVTGNFINIAKTLAVRHQMLQAISIKQNRLLNSEFLVHDGCQIDLKDRTQGSRTADLLHAIIVTDCRSVSIFSTTYAIGDSVLFEREDEGIPQIGFVHHPSVCFGMHVTLKILMSISILGKLLWITIPK